MYENTKTTNFSRFHLRFTSKKNLKDIFYSNKHPYPLEYDFYPNK